MSDITVKLLLIFAFTNICIPAQGAMAVEPSYTANILSEKVELKATRVLSKYLKPDEFEVVASVSMKENSEKSPDAQAIPYDPITGSPLQGFAGSSTLDPISLKEFINNIDLTVILNKKIKEKHKTALSKILSQAIVKKSDLNLNIVFENMDLKIEVSEPATENLIKKMREEMDLMKEKNQAVERERDDLSSKLSRLQEELEKKTRELFNEKLGISDFLTLLKRNAGIMSASAAWILGILALALIFGKMLSASFHAIAKALTNIGNSLRQQEAPAAEGQSALAELLGTSKTEAPPPDTENIEKRLEELRKHLKSIISPGNFHVLTQYVERVVGDKQAERGVALLEFLGPPESSQVFEKLSLDVQQDMVKFMQSGSFSGDKNLVMLMVGEEVKTKLFSENYDIIARAYNTQIKELLIQIPQEELSELFLQLEQNLLPRVMLHMGSDKIGKTLSAIKNKDEQRFSAVLDCLHQIPSATQNSSEDDQIINFLKEKIEKLTNEKDRVFINVFAQIVENVEDSIEDSVIEALSSRSRVIGEYMQKNMINFSTLFKISEKQREDIIDTLSNQQIAALLLELSDDDGEKISSTLSQRRMENVEEAKESINSQGPNQRKNLLSGAKSLVTKKLKKLQEEQKLELINDGEDGQSNK